MLWVDYQMDTNDARSRKEFRFHGTLLLRKTFKALSNKIGSNTDAQQRLAKAPLTEDCPW